MHTWRNFGRERRREKWRLLLVAVRSMHVSSVVCDAVFWRHLFFHLLRQGWFVIKQWDPTQCFNYADIILDNYAQFLTLNTANKTETQIIGWVMERYVCLYGYDSLSLYVSFSLCLSVFLSLSVSLISRGDESLICWSMSLLTYCHKSTVWGPECITLPYR